MRDAMPPRYRSRPQPPSLTLPIAASRRCPPAAVRLPAFPAMPSPAAYGCAAEFMPMTLFFEPRPTNFAARSGEAAAAVAAAALREQIARRCLLREQSARIAPVINVTR